MCCKPVVREWIMLTVQGHPPTDWDVYGYGTAEYVDLFKAAMQASLENNMTFDYAMNNNGAVPAEWNNPGLSWALVWHLKDHPP